TASAPVSSGGVVGVGSARSATGVLRDVDTRGTALLHLSPRGGPPPTLPALTAMPVASRTLVLAWLLAIALELAAFLALPHQAEYLIPAVPFVLLLGARILTPRAFGALAVAIFVSSLVLKASEMGKPDSPGVSAASLRL